MSELTDKLRTAANGYKGSEMGDLLQWAALHIDSQAEALEELREAHAEEEAERIRALEPVAWINEEQTIGPNYGKKRLSFEPFYSCNPLHYKHTPLYAAPPQASQRQCGEIARAAIAATGETK